MERCYAGLICDFDGVATDKLHDLARAESDARIAYVWNASGTTPVVGVRLLSTFPLSNATILDPAVFRYPDSALSKKMKFDIISGSVRQLTADRSADWSVAVATGPFEFCPGSTRRVAFAVVGGDDIASFLAHCDSAQSWYRQFVGISDEASDRIVRQPVLSVMPNPSSGQIRISYQVRSAGRVTLKLFDASGREVAGLLDRKLPVGAGALNWQAHGLTRGVYFLKFATEGEALTAKLLLLR